VLKRGDKVAVRKLNFTVLPGEGVSASVWSEVSALFSSEYGFYSQQAPLKAGERIRLGVGYYEKSYAKQGFSVALCRDGERLVAHVIYCERMTTRGRTALVVQLVVAEAYRHQGVASTLLHAIWGFSDYYAWGIVSSNAFTIEALEAATFRKTSPSVVLECADWLREEVLRNVPFLSSAECRITDSESIVNSRFYTDRSGAKESIASVSARLGALAEGEEWLAVVFRHQLPDDFSAYRTMVATSSDLVREAYRRMPQDEHAWASRTADEIDRILTTFPEIGKDASIVDFGAGTGRHVSELRRRGYARARGLDFIADGTSDLVARADCRTWKSDEPIDMALCLYDVVGSFPEDADNERIVRNVAANLKDGGVAVFSVSNWNFLDRLECREIILDDEAKALQALFALPPSKTMQMSGEFFDGRYVLVDPVRHIVCHKEQFPAGNGMLPGEYLIQDRRFTETEIRQWLVEAGFEVIETCFVRAGFKVEHAVSTGKEILLFVRKVRNS